MGEPGATASETRARDGARSETRAGAVVGKRLLAWGGLVVYALIIVWLSSQSRLPAGIHLPQGTDKLAHGLEYAILCSLCLLAIRPQLKAKNMLFLFAFLLLFALSDEWHQSFVPGRDASLYDIVADLVGASLVLYFARRLQRARV